ncbi:hypothetical protein [Ralstonia phage phiRSL1]|uniref:Uncharacterized protein n=1 Tax=Ralstonia phage phiRSL1 TaxID=1980924 RepID=C4T8W7_9CAUD|nr:hypothetical protein RSL1_ORF020 [Ralstonia phage phiRSL1]BAH72941.1 hypothetical protein [Ralstonia phage phiRSL1]
MESRMRKTQYPDIPYHSAGYLVMIGDDELYWGYSHHVARLVAHVMRAIVW